MGQCSSLDYLGSSWQVQGINSATTKNGIRGEVIKISKHLFAKLYVVLIKKKENKSMNAELYRYNLANNL